MTQLATATCRINRAGIFMPNALTRIPAAVPHHTRTNPSTIGVSNHSGDPAASTAPTRADAIHRGAPNAAADSPSVPAMSRTPPVVVEKKSNSPLIMAADYDALDYPRPPS